MRDLYTAVRDLSFKDAKCGHFDIENPSPIRLLSYIGQSSEWLMNSEELKGFPVEFQNLESDKAMEIAVCNRTRVATEIFKKEKSTDCSSSGAAVVPAIVGGGDDDDVELVEVDFDSEKLVVKFDFDHGRREVEDARQVVLLTKSTLLYFS